MLNRILEVFQRFEVKELISVIQNILDYLTQTYHPHTIVTYGSFVSGTQTDASDFDVLLVGDACPTLRDNTVISGILLDAFVYQTEDFLKKTVRPDELIQAYEGRILLDERGLAQELLESLRAYVARHSAVNENTKAHLRGWCAKMLNRAGAGDPEGMLRWHWLIYDSLEIYCTLRDRFYFGPKKTMAFLRAQQPDAWAKLERALYTLEFEALKDWISCVVAEHTN